MSFVDAAPDMELGESTGTHLLETLDEFVAALDAMVPQAKRHIKIFTQELDHAFYDRPAFIDALSPLFRDRRGFSVSVILKDANKAAKLGHRLVELQKRLPTRCEIRSLPREYEDMTDEYLIVDDQGMVKRFALGTLRGHCEFRAVPDGVKYGRQFNDIWERSLPCTELRRLSL